MVGSSSTLKKSCILSTQVVLVLALSSLVAVAQTHKNQPPKPCAERLSTIKPELDWTNHGRPWDHFSPHQHPFNLQSNGTWVQGPGMSVFR